MSMHFEQQFHAEYAPGGRVPFMASVVACGDPASGERRFVFGWAREVVLAMDRDDRDPVPMDMGAMTHCLPAEPDYSVRVEWAGHGMHIADRWPDAAAWATARERTAARIAAWDSLADVPDDLIREAAST